ncbi:MAG: hypothetical protein VX589_12305 [Myxococcota bacterium]|nr:hypothetical protein [Myxococcota bacterium]
MSPFKLETAEMYQLALQLVCTIDGWAGKMRARRPDIEVEFQQSLLSLLTMLSKARHLHADVDRDAHFTRTHDRLHHLAALIDMTGALHLMAPSHVQSARKTLNQLKSRCIAAVLPLEPRPPTIDDYPLCS